MATVITEFLRRGHNAVLARLQRREVTGVRILGVLGNEGGDMDSVVGALFTALAVDAGVVTVPEFEASAPAKANRIVVPLLNFPAADLPLRGDIVAAFTGQGIDPRGLYLSAVEAHPNFDGLDAPDVLSLCDHLVLFDHNELNKAQRHHGAKVIGIIDHHVDTGASPNAQPRIVEKCGSATSLLTRVEDSTLVAELPCAVPLLLGAVVVDTMNFDPAMKKVTAQDVRHAASLLLRKPPHFPQLASLDEWPNDVREETLCWLQRECRAVYDLLSSKKYDVSHLSIPENLRRDFKSFQFQVGAHRPLEIGFSAWLESIDAVVQRHGAESLATQLGAYAQLQHLDAVVVMFAFGAEEDFRRQALFWVNPSSELASISDRLLSDFFLHRDETRHAGPRFDPDSVAVLNAALKVPERLGAMRATEQRGTDVSRKGLVPMMMEAFKP